MRSRLSKILSLMAKQHLDAALVSSIPNIIYLTNFSHFSKDEREAFLFITRNKQYILTDGRYAEAVKNHMRNQILSLPKYELVETSSKRTFEKALKVLAKKHKVRRVGFEQDDISVSEHKKISACFNNLTHVMQTRHSGLTGYRPRTSRFGTGTCRMVLSRLVPVLSRISQNDGDSGVASPGARRYLATLPRMTQHKMSDLKHFSMKHFRAIKNAKEVSAIEEACKIGGEAFKYILNRIKRGITEKQLAFEIEFFIKKHGADISFPPIVAFGKNSSIPHHKASDQRLASSGQFILLDFGVKLNNYCSDTTRTVFFGSASAKFKKMYLTVLAAQKKAIEYIVTHLGGGRMYSSEVKFCGIKASQVDKVARDYIISKGYPTIPHSLGHGVGLEVHESPRLSQKSKDILKPGMVFTIEPGIYIEGFGGVRIEDVVVLEKSGPRLLTKSSKEIIEL